MNSQVYSREYLQSIPEQRKQQQIDCIVSYFVSQLVNAAAEGKTSYMYVKPETEKIVRCHPSPPVLTDADLIAGFMTRFPGCKVSYEEEWVETRPNTRTLKKGIVIDWS